MPNMDPNKRYKIPNVKGNQKAIRIKRSQTDSKHPYSKINLAAAEVALGVLQGNAFKLWLWFCLNINNYEFALSSEMVCQDLKIGVSTYNKAVHQLIENGYLRQALLYPKFTGWVFVEGGQLEPFTQEELDLKLYQRKQQNSTAPAQQSKESSEENFEKVIENSAGPAQDT